MPGMPEKSAAILKFIDTANYRKMVQKTHVVAF